MADGQITRRYAQALYEEARDQGHLSMVDEDVAFLRESLDQAPQLERVLKSPVIPQKKKQGVLESLVKPRVGALTYRFVELLLSKDREEILERMLRAYRTLRDRQEGIVEAEVRTAHPLSEEEGARLEEAVGRITGKPNVRLQTEREPDLIGGVVVRVGDTVYDGSVRHQLASLRDRLVRQADVAEVMNTDPPDSGNAGGDGAPADGGNTGASNAGGSSASESPDEGV
jgi:F-type H+-transporting ATPase subunit delta